MHVWSKVNIHNTIFTGRDFKMLKSRTHLTSNLYNNISLIGPKTSLFQENNNVRSSAQRMIFVVLVDGS